MLIKNADDCPQFVANDGCLLRELLHPKNDPIDPGCSIALAEVPAGGRTKRHSLAQAEIYFLLSGQGRMHIGAENAAVATGDAVFIPPHSVQWLENTGLATLRFLAVVCPPWRAAADRLVD
jgi:mannose-6-phosphate isomerase-like protein (cupin superfamily)